MLNFIGGMFLGLILLICGYYFETCPMDHPYYALNIGEMLVPYYIGSSLEFYVNYLWYLFTCTKWIAQQFPLITPWEGKLTKKTSYLWPDFYGDLWYRFFPYIQIRLFAELIYTIPGVPSICKLVLWYINNIGGYA